MSGQASPSAPLPVQDANAPHDRPRGVPPPRRAFPKLSEHLRTVFVTAVASALVAYGAFLIHQLVDDAPFGGFVPRPASPECGPWPRRTKVMQDRCQVDLDVLNPTTSSDRFKPSAVYLVAADESTYDSTRLSGPAFNKIIYQAHSEHGVATFRTPPDLVFKSIELHDGDDVLVVPFDDD
jgi:hypothetical protein